MGFKLEMVSWELDGEKVMVRGHFKAVPAVAGWTAVYIVDDDGNLLNTEPVCTVCERYHPWFVEVSSVVRRVVAGAEVS
jgi:hypothetical protein